jgi:hypothetical protein
MSLRMLSIGVGRVWSALQAFYQSFAFNANIGAWNTARVTTLNAACAASAVARNAARMQRGAEVRSVGF